MIWFAKYFLTFHRSPFHQLCFLMKRKFSFWQNPNCLLFTLVLSVIFIKSLQNKCHNFSPYTFSKHFIVWSLTFRIWSLWLNFCVGDQTMTHVTHLHADIAVQHSLLERLSFLHWIAFTAYQIILKNLNAFPLTVNLLASRNGHVSKPAFHNMGKSLH